nr:immunoglobulin light chain junction region [Macaca mulatta]
CQQYDSTPYSF